MVPILKTCSFSRRNILTGVDKLGLVAHLQVVEDRGIVEESQVGHVLAFLKLGRVDLANLGRRKDFFLEKNDCSHFSYLNKCVRDVFTKWRLIKNKKLECFFFRPICLKFVELNKAHVQDVLMAHENTILGWYIKEVKGSQPWCSNGLWKYHLC